MTSRTTILTENLTQIRAEVQRLLGQQAELEAALAVHATAPAPHPRPGWPIRRLGADASRQSLH